MPEPSSRAVLRFEDFELDVRGYQLRHRGRPVRLERQPMELLIMLAERRGELVTRQDIIARLWGDDAVIDVETGLNTAIRKIRQALHASPDNRRAGAVVETVSGKGYRFAADLAPASPDMARPVMLAVLPFVNMTGDAEREYLADGLTEDTIAAIGRIDPSRLRVIGRTSAMSYKRTSKSLAAIGSELNAEFIVEGSLRLEGPTIRIRCTLNRVADQAQIWSAAYDRDATGIASVIHDVAGALAAQLHPQPAGTPTALPVERQSRDADAYDAYLRGRRFWYQLTPATTRKAVEYYRRATDIDPQYALAWTGIAEALASAPINGDAEPLAMWSPARDAAQRAIEANPYLSEAHTVRGQVNWFFEWDWPAAINAHRQAIALDPGNAWSHSMLGHTLSQLGRHHEGIPFMEQACTLEPMAAIHHAMASQVAFQAGDLAAARQRARRTIAIDPEFWVGYMMLGQACAELGDREIALDALATAARLSDGNSKPVGLRGYILGSCGHADAAREVLSMLEDLSRIRFVPPFAMALVWSGLGDEQRVFEWLDRACDVRDVHLAFLTVDPKWDRYRSHPVFVSLLERCDFERTARLKTESRAPSQRITLSGNSPVPPE